MEILVPSIPKRLSITQTMMEDIICDPVLGGKLIMGREYDAFQKARLRYYWWFPDVIDESSFSTGKTLVDFDYVQLRCIIITNFTGLPHWAGVYYPTFETGKNTFWPYYATTRAPIFRAHLGSTEDDLAANKRKRSKSEGAACFKAYYKNGAQVLMPAPSFLKDANTQASLRLNTLLVEEWTHIDASSDGIDGQLIGRVTRDSFNREHPIWSNHRTFTAPAKPVHHPSNERVVKHKAEVRKGNIKFHYIRWCYKDWSNRKSATDKSFREEYRDDATIRRLKVSMGKADFEGEGLGVRRRSGKGWYAEELLYPCRRTGLELGIEPVIGRAGDPWDSDHTHYFGGGDTAPAQGKKSDDGAVIILRARPKQLRLNPPQMVRGKREPVIYSRMPADWDLALVYGQRIRKASSREWSGHLHQLHRWFRFTKLMMDHGGGGQWVQPDLKLQEQEIAGVKQTCRPIATIDDRLVHDTEAERILLMASRGDYLLRTCWPDMKGDDVLVDKLHTETKTLLEHGELVLCPTIEDLIEAGVDWQKWPEGKQWALKILSQLVNQMESIAVLTDKNGNPTYTRHNARQFEAAGKKDFVSAATFAVAAFLIWLQTMDEDAEAGEEGEEMFLSSGR